MQESNLLADSLMVSILAILSYFNWITLGEQVTIILSG